MKLSWIWALFFLHLVIFGVESYITGAGAFGRFASTLNIMLKPHLAEQSTAIVAAFTFVINVAGYFEEFISVITLQPSSVWTGGYQWIQYYIMFPTNIATVIALVIIARGVGMA